MNKYIKESLKYVIVFIIWFLIVMYVLSVINH